MCRRAVTAAAGPAVAPDVQSDHPNGSIPVIRGLERGPDSTRLHTLVTTADRAVELNRNGFMVLIDNAGQRYRLVPPPDNESVEVPPNSRLTGEMVFSGRVDPAAERVTLSTNDGSGGSASNRFSSRPEFRVEIPLEG
jgi:hypothetical protein